MQPGILTRSLSSPFSSSSSHQLPHKGATTAYQGFAALPAIAKYPNGARGENALLIEALKDEILQFAESLGLPSRTASSSSSLDEVLFIALRALKSKYPKCLSRFEDSDACESIKKDLHQLYRVLNFVKDFSDEKCNKFAKLNDDGTLNSLNFELIGKQVLEMLICSNTPQMREMFESAETSIETESSSVGKKRKLIHESSKPKPIPILRENPRAGSSKPEPIPILRENPRAGLILKDFSDNKPYLTPRLRPLRLQSLGRLTPVPPYCVVPLASSPNIGSLRDSDKPKDDLKHDDLDDSWGMDHGCQTFRMAEDEENEDDRPSHEDSFVLMSEPPSNRRKRVEAPVTPSASPAFALFHQRMMFPIDTTPTPPSSPMFLTGMPMFFQSCRPEMDGVPYAMIIDDSSIENYDSDETKQFIVGTPPTNGIVGTPMIFELATPRATSPMAPPMQFALQSPQKDVSLASTPPPLPARSMSTIKSAPAPPELPGKRNDLSMRVAPPPTPPPLPPSITTNSSPKVSAQPPPPPPPPPRANNSIVTKGPLPPPLPQSRLSKESSSTNVPSRPTPPPPPGSSLKGPAPPPPPPGGAARALRAIKATKLKRSSQMGNLYRLLKGKVEGSSLEGKTSHAKKGQGGGSSGGKGGQGMADALAEMTKRSAYFQQIEEDVAKHAKSILELKNELTKFQSKDMAELVKFHKHVEQRLECLTDETQVLARFEGFPSKKLECLRMAAALYAKLDGIVSSIKNWKLISPVVQQLDKIETRFNKIKEEMDVIERTKDDENKRFKAQNIDFDFTILVRIKESMVDLSSNCIELALKESKDAKEEATTGGTPTTGKNQANGAGVSKMLWRAFQLAFRVYNFAGGQDEQADRLTAELANEIETFPH